MSRLGLASKALKTYLYGARNLRDSLVPFVSEDMSHVSNLRLRVQATSEKITSGVAQKPPHIMPWRTRARPRVDLATRPHVDRATLSLVGRVARPVMLKREPRI